MCPNVPILLLAVLGALRFLTITNSTAMNLLRGKLVLGFPRARFPSPISQMKNKDVKDQRVNWVHSSRTVVTKVYSDGECCSNTHFFERSLQTGPPGSFECMLVGLQPIGGAIEHPKAPSPDWNGGSGSFPRAWEAGWKGGWRDRQKGHCPKDTGT